MNTGNIIWGVLAVSEWLCASVKYEAEHLQGYNADLQACTMQLATSCRMGILTSALLTVPKPKKWRNGCKLCTRLWPVQTTHEGFTFITAVIELPTILATANWLAQTHLI